MAQSNKKNESFFLIFFTENMTVNAIKRLWIELKELNMFPVTECQQRAKRDEDRFKNLFPF